MGNDESDQCRPDRIGEEMGARCHPADAEERAEYQTGCQRDQGPARMASAPHPPAQGIEISNRTVTAGERLAASRGRSEWLCILKLSAELYELPGPGPAPMILQHHVNDQPRADGHAQQYEESVDSHLLRSFSQHANNHE